MKVYAIKDSDGTLRLVKARSKHHAMRHCKFTAKVATQDELIDWLQAGKQIEQSTANYSNDETDDEPSLLPQGEDE